MTIDIEYDCVATPSEEIPQPADMLLWVKGVATQLSKSALFEHIRIVDEPESQTLNRTYRHKDYPTNVLAFPADPEDAPYIGDLVICAPVVKHQAAEQHKTTRAHWAHLIVHGSLHLSGYDHVEPEQAAIMEALEIQILNTLGFDNPYIEKG